jgi:putative transposase
MVTPAAKREAVAHLRGQFEVSERRACTVLGVDRTSVRYRSRRADDDAIRAPWRASGAGAAIGVSTFSWVRRASL